MELATHALNTPRDAYYWRLLATAASFCLFGIGGLCLRVLVFPFGRRHTGPSDELDAEVAELIGRSKGDPALEELLAGCYRPQAEGDPVAALQRASDLLDDTAPLRKALHQAIKEGDVQSTAGQSAIDAALAAGVLQPGEGLRLLAHHGVDALMRQAQLALAPHDLLHVY